MPFKLQAGGLALGVAFAFAAASAGFAPLRSQPAATSSIVSADPAIIQAGEKGFATNCGECHSINKDGRTVMGPNLWRVIGRKLGAVSDFGYSDALANSKLVWTPENLDKWLESPAGFVPDNMMPFIGLKDSKQRAAIISYIAKRGTEDD